MHASHVGAPGGVLYGHPSTEHSRGAGGAIVDIEGITGSFGFVHGSLIVLIITYQRASTRPVELLKEEIALDLLYM